MSFVNRIQKSQNSNLWLIRTVDASRRNCYFYLMVEPLKKTLLQNRVGQAGLRLIEYGTILASGFGENPPEEVKARMKAEYGFEESN